MAKLIYSAITSLDGYIADEQGNFDWAAPDAEVHGFINDLERSAGTYLYGRRMYETMLAWETDPALAEASPLMADFAQIWQAADKIVYSTVLGAVATERTRLERRLDPEALRGLKASASRDMLIGGPSLASHAFRAKLVDECHVFLVPIIVGAGTRFLPNGVRLKLALSNQRRFANGTVYLQYQVSSGAETGSKHASATVPRSRT